VIGQLFGNYRALALLGEGGMGAVYLAEHPEIGRKVAVKVLRAELGKDPQLLVRFLNEARAANAIRHPNIIEILDSGSNADGVPYLVMELLEGESLAGRLRRLGRLPVEGALAVAHQTASALGAAHAKGIVHRDLKPDNLFVVPEPMDPGRERVKVLDFGIAKLQRTDKGDSVRTRTGTLMGTPVYMSPEQCLGTKELDHRSDVYALGVILFEMLCGRPPFVSEGFGELVNMHLNVPPAPPRSLRPELSEPLEALVLRMLAKKPEERPQSMAAVMSALEGCADPAMPLRGPSAARASDLALGATAALPTGGGTAALPTGGGTTALPTGGDIARGSSGRPATGSTTFRGSAGEAGGPDTPPRRKRHPVLVGAAAAILVIGVGTFITTRRATPPPPAPPPTPIATPEPPAPATVRLVLDSAPTGARVVRDDTGEALGLTPLDRTLPAGPGRLVVRLEREGFLPQTLPVSLQVGHAGRVTLQPLPEAPARPAKPGKTNAAKPRREPRPPRSEEPAKL
jgi:serine/threonine-protein kinase